MQGGPLSPLLSNVVLDELDWELDRCGLRFVRYADDFNIFVRSERAGHRVLGSIRRFIEGRLRLKINEEKSSVDRPANLHLLGFCLKPGKNGRVEVYLSTRTTQRLSQRGSSGRVGNGTRARSGGAAIGARVTPSSPSTYLLTTASIS